METEILVCEDESPPTRKTSSVKPLCSFETTIDIPAGTIADWKNPDGKTFKRLDYDLEMVPSGATLDFGLYVKGKR